jgi:glucose/arabinose dehydrogenase
LAPNGDLFVADSASNTVRVLRVPAGSALPTQKGIFARGLYQPFGIAFFPLGPNPEWNDVANSDSIVRFPYKNGDVTASRKPEQIVGRIPWVHHWTRDIVCSPDGKGCCSRSVRDGMPRSTCLPNR